MAGLDERRRRALSVAVGVVLIAGSLGVVAYQRGQRIEPAAAPTETTATEPPGFAYGTAQCAPATRPTEPRRSFEAAPRQCIDPETTDYGAIVHTAKGDITIDLDEGGAPGTVNNFVTLVGWGFYDGLVVSRVAADEFMQLGNPFNAPTTTADVGYTIPDERLPASVVDYPVGAVAMANTGANTANSQWFVWTGPNQLAGPSYVQFGVVTAGLDVAKAIVALATDLNITSEFIVVDHVEITERPRT